MASLSHTCRRHVSTEGLEPIHAFITGPDGMGMRDLGTLGGSQSSAYGINDAGQAVGYSDTAGGSEHAFITGPNGEGMVDLNSLVDLPHGVILTEAAGINNNGQVIAMGVIPEPETYALMFAGLGLIGFMDGARRWRTRTREPGDTTACSTPSPHAWQRSCCRHAPDP